MYCSNCLELSQDGHVVKKFKRADSEFVDVRVDKERSAGGDKIVVCDRCDYKANVEKAESVVPSVNVDSEMLPLKVVEQPTWVCSMEDNIKHYGKHKSAYLKNVVYKSEEGKLIIVVLRGDRDANEIKIKSFLGVSSLEMATDKDLSAIGTKAGWVHSWGHDESNDNVVYIVDNSVLGARNLIGGYKEETTDTINVNYGRDFKHELEGDFSVAQAGDKCKFCEEGFLKEKRVIEVGHIFKYDDYYSKPHKATYVDKDGKEQYLLMGAYGIGIGRAMAMVAELHHGKNSIIWPKEIAPFLINIVTIGRNEETKKIAQTLYEKLHKEFGDDVLIDDRDMSPGMKFAEADLIGAYVRIIVSDRNLEKGFYEIKIGDNKPIMQDVGSFDIHEFV
jgi:prolyl-tRNA synthetase